MIFARTQSEFDEGSRVWHSLALPSVIGLIATHCRFTSFVPGARSIPAQVMLTDQGLLDCLGPLGIDLLLTADLRGFLFASRALARMRYGCPLSS